MTDNLIEPAPTPAPPALAKSGGLSLAALIVGIGAAVSAFIPGLSFATWAPAGVAIVLGIITLVSHRPTRGRGIAAIVLGAVAWLVAIIVSVVFIAALSSSTTSHTASLGAPEAAVPSAAAASPSATPVAPPIPADTVYSGSGDSVIPVAKPDGADSLAAATITATGSSNFAVWSIDSNAQQIDLLVNTIGNYSGTVLMDEHAGGQTASLQITADGAWTVTIHSLKALREFTGNAATGSGDDVIVYRGAAGAADITNTGSSNFAVWTYGDDSDLVVNEIGNYTGTDLWQAGPSVVQVTSDGNWSITVK
jgi:hypothetical protein